MKHVKKPAVKERALKEQQRLDRKIKKQGYNPTANRRIYIKEIEKLERRLKAFQQKTGQRIFLEELNVNLSLDRVTQRMIEQVKGLGAKQFKKYKEEKDNEAPDIADIVIEQLRAFIISYAESKVGDNNREYNIANSGAATLLDYLDRGIAAFGKEVVARNAENLNEAYGVASQYMDESNSDRAGMLLGQFGELVFGRAMSFAEMVGMERYAEYNGNYA